jgi:Arc/MetJ family transcription regulator
MRTAIDLEEDLLREAMRVTGAKTHAAVVRLGLEVLFDQAARRRLGAKRGQIPEAEGPRRRRPSRS